MAEETKSFLICFCQMAKMVHFQISPSNQPIWFPNVILCSAGSSHLNECISWRPLSFASLLCQPVKQMSDELKLGCLLPVCAEAGSGCNGGQRREINLPFTKSSLVCLSSGPGSNPVGLLPTTWRGSVRNYGHVSWCSYTANRTTGTFERECLVSVMWWQSGIKMVC